MHLRDKSRGLYQSNVISSLTVIQRPGLQADNCKIRYCLTWRVFSFFVFAEVVREGLTHPSIPDGWRWNGVVSDHCPVWAEFYCDRDSDETTGPPSVDNIAIDGK